MPAMRFANTLGFVFAILLTTIGHAQDRPLPPKEAASHMTLPRGFQATLFAGEPDVKQPIAFTFDDRGRLWVCECYSYPKWHKDPSQGKDRVLVFEDTDGDGKFNKCTLFAHNLPNLPAIAPRFPRTSLSS